MLITTKMSQELRRTGISFIPGTEINGAGLLGFGCCTFFSYGLPLFLQSCSLGIYSATHSALYNCAVGNYCSIARFSGLCGNHPLDRLTTSEITYYDRGGIYTFKKENFCSGAGRTYIGHDVWIGMHVCIMEGVHIGNGAVIGANAVVTHDVPDFAIMAGVPARILRMRFSDHLIGRIRKSQWFLYDWQGIQIAWTHPNQALDTMEKYIAEGKAPQGKFYNYQVDDETLQLCPAEEAG